MKPRFIAFTVILLFTAIFGFIVLRNQGLGKVAYPQAVLSIQKKSFTALESVVMRIDLKALGMYRDGFPDLIKKAYATSSGPVSVRIIDPSGDSTEEIPIQIIEEASGIYEISATPPLSFEPGKYTMSVTLSDGLATHELTQDFTWGVLAINTNKSTYSPGEMAKLFIAVLNDRGDMVCDAKVTLVIIDPNGLKQTLSTEQNSIKVNPACFLKAFTMESDYETRYTTGVSGWYAMELSAVSRNGTYTISDSFLVMEDPPFDVERVTATRIFPPATYPMNLVVSANRDFDGIVQMIVPEDFEIWPLEGVQEYSDVSHTTLFEDDRTENVKSLQWKVTMKKGETVALGYKYKTPPKSPEFYLLGPFSFYEHGDLESDPVFQASRRWQLAIDADGSGTNSVNPNTGNTSVTGQTYTFTFTASETMDSGGVSVVVPAGWSEPQGTGGVAGYTTVTGNGSALTADVWNNADSITNWAEDDTDMCNTANLAVDTVIFHEGTGSILCNNNSSTGPDAGDSFSYDIANQNWSAYSKIGFWVRSDDGLASGDFRTGYDNAIGCGNMTSATEVFNIPAITADTWTYVTFTLTATRTDVDAWCFFAGTAGGIDNDSVWVDDLLIGPGSPTFSGSGPWTVNFRILQAANTETFSLVYGDTAGGGGSTVTNSASSGVHTFTTQSRFDDSGTLTNISSQPTVTLADPTPTPTPTSTPTPTTFPGRFDFEGVDMEGLLID